MSPKSKSKVWQYFKRIEDGVAVCKLCDKKIKTSGNTTNLMGHIKRIHKNHISTLTSPVYTTTNGMELENDDLDPDSPATIESFELEPGSAGHGSESSSSTATIGTVGSNSSSNFNCSFSSTASQQREKDSEMGEPSTSGLIAELKKNKQKSIVSSFQNINSFKTNGKKYVSTTNAILFMMCKDNQPLSLVENTGFKHLLHELVPFYQIPSRRTFTRLLNNKYEVLSNNLKQKLSKFEYFTITTDVWTESYQTKSFLGITIHFLENIEMKSATFGVYPLEERHTAKYISEKLEEILTQWNIPHEKIMAFVTDGGANIVKAVHDSFGKFKHLFCFAHTLNLVADNSIKKTEQISGILKKIRDIVGWFKRSVVAADELHKLQVKENNGIEENCLKLIQDVPTRWNSTFYMIQRFIQLNKFVTEILMNNRQSPEMLTAAELDIIKELKDLLRPLEKATKEISADRFVTLSKVIPIVHCINNVINTKYPENEQTKVFLKNLKEELVKRFGQMESSLQLAAATILDPRFKKIHFEDIIAVSKAVKYIKNNMTNLPDLVERMDRDHSNNNEMASPIEVGNEDDDFDLWHHHKTLLGESQGGTDDEEKQSLIDAEMSQYLNSSLADIKENPFLAWEKLKLIYPRLYQLARRQLQVPATSVPAERLFSKAGQIMTETRSRIKPKRLQQLLFLNSMDKQDWI